MSTLDDFGDYVASLDSETRFAATALKKCRLEICNAVYGIGNRDISGIGSLATLVVLARKDYGLGTADLGALKTQIAQAIAVVSLLPLLYPAALLEAAAPQ
ncbi:hypothetical protein ACO1O0_008302 [Amphichorda felina]